MLPKEMVRHILQATVRLGVLIGALVMCLGTAVHAEPVKKLTIAHGFGQYDPFLNEVLRPWAAELQSATEGRLQVSLNSTHQAIVSEIDSANSSQFSGVFFVPSVEGAQGAELLASVPSFASERPLSELSQDIWKFHQDQIGRSDVYGGAIAIGIAAYSKPYLAEIESENPISSVQLERFGISLASGSDTELLSPGRFLVTGSIPMLQEFEFEQISNGNEVEISYTGNFHQPSLGARAGALLINPTVWQTLTDADKRSIERVTMKAFTRNLQFIDWQTDQEIRLAQSSAIEMASQIENSAMAVTGLERNHVQSAKAQLESKAWADEAITSFEFNF